MTHEPAILVRLPGAADCDTAARTATAAGAVVFRDRVSRSTPAHPVAEASGPVLIGAQWWLSSDIDAPESAIARYAGRGTFVEVTTVEQASRAIAAGATRLVACGAEGGGLVSHESTLVLVRRVLGVAEPVGVRVWARGGVGPDSAAACTAAGAAGVMLDSQLLSADDVPLSDAMSKRIARFNPADTQALGVPFGVRYRVFAQLATKPVRALAKAASAGNIGPAEWWAQVDAATAAHAHQADPKVEVVELGQDAGLGRLFVERCGWTTVGTIVAELTRRLSSQEAAMVWPWGEGGGIATVNHTRYPLHQGPMAQVADVPAFATAVADAGAMPWLALANMPADIAEATVKATLEAMGGRPFGAGIIGLDANRYRDQHIEMLKRVRPPAVMVAAGTVEQARDFDDAGLTTWLHTPTPGLLEAALDAGIRRFILEGTEAGGHVGQLGSLVLWQLGVDVMLKAVEGGIPAGELSFCMAGGLGDAASSRAVAALVQPLVKLGVRCGQQMGTAYLMTREAVETGAIRPEYQRQIASADQTVLMGETVRAPTRVLPTEAAGRIFESELERERSDAKLHAKKSAFEHDNLGGLRAAAKGQKIVAVDAIKGATFAELDVSQQQEQGLYHAGQVAALLSETRTMAEFHRLLTERGEAPLSAPAAQPQQRPHPAAAAAAKEPIAIVGVGAVLPDAPDVSAFWRNLQSGHCAIDEVPNDRWDPELLWSADRKAPDLAYSKIGAFVRNFEFDRKAFRIPPKVVKSLDRAQQMALEAGRQALDDAGRDTLPTENCAVIIGNTNGGELRLETALRTEIPGLKRNLEAALAGSGLSAAHRQQVIDRFVNEALAGRAPITEDTMAGELPNCIAGRMAGTFDLGGPNFVTDAACASSLAAIHVAIRGLRDGEYDAALVGGVDSLMSPEPYVKFCKIGALSPDGSKPFDADANGFVMGEGSAMFVLMRESDARASGRAIYARILGSGASSDGRGKGITAPNPRGQVRAMSRAYRDAGVDPKQVTMFEAHGTGTAVGDPVEVGSLVETVGATAHGASLGSVKSNIGHLKAGAGAAAILKATLALKNATLVPTLSVTTPNPKLPLEQGKLNLQLTTEDWNVPVGVPRLAGVSAFGFGGTNVHVVLAEADGPTQERRDMTLSTTNLSAPKAVSAPAAAPAARATGGDVIFARLVELVCERTGYDADELEPDFELEADLGIDTVKQAEIMAAVRESYGLEADADFRLADYPTLQGLADYVVERLGTRRDGATLVAEPAPAAAEASAPAADSASSGPDPDAVYQALVGLVCDRTGYDGDELEPDFELEADLGIDTVKQAEIMAAVREAYGLAADSDFRLADYPTLAGLATYVVQRLGASGIVSAPAASSPGQPAPAPEAVSADTMAGLLVLGAANRDELAPVIVDTIVNLRANGLSALGRLDRATAAKQPSRVAIAFDPSEGADALVVLLEKAGAVIAKGRGEKLLANKGVYFGDGMHDGKVAFLFPGQGSQYLGMLADLAADFPQVRATFDEADAVMADILERPLSSYINPTNITDDASKKRAFIDLTRTEITQPAMLTADIALLRVLDHLGFTADMFAGHSLGEYGACVAAGVMDFATALRTVAARGTAMASVRPMDGDNGKMAAVSGPVAAVEAVLEEVDGYVVCANKNCPGQTVIGGSSGAVDDAMAALEARGMDVRLLPVSHAFHTRVVAEASAPLRAHLESMQIKAPSKPILSNVTADYYPSDPGDIADLLSKQVAAPVEFIREVERMYADGARTFVEVGPKRAQAGFVSATLDGKPGAYRAIHTNHPKLGGRTSLRRALGQLVAAGLYIPAPAAGSHRTAAADSRPATRRGDTSWAIPMPVVCTGTALGVPGTAKVFDELHEERIGAALFEAQQTLIGHLDDDQVDRMLAQKITRLEKSADCTANFVAIESREQAIKLAGRLGDFDLAADFGVDDRVVRALDAASQLALAAGLEAMRHAGIPLVPKYRTTRSGKQIANGWTLPKALQNGTGVIFASGYSGLDAAFQAAQDAANQKDYSFDPRLLLKVMAMGHSRFAEVIGARGPNTSVNVACASTTSAVSTAEDWIRGGRCERVIIIGADHVTSEAMMPWIGSGFLASGAATYAADPTQAALPFDARRNGTILGAGAVALVLESADAAGRRGIIPVADLVATHIGNSAFHPTRLDVEHVAESFETFLREAERRLMVDRSAIAEHAVFVSHETFTPARGGSAAAEVEGLRSAFGAAAERLWISNVKGYTGHPMGAGLEDAVALLMLQGQRLLGLPHLEQPDPALGNLRYATDEPAQLDYALRFAAGFGSQLALVLWRRRATTTDRIDAAAHTAWLREIAPELGSDPELWVDTRVLKARKGKGAVKSVTPAQAPVTARPVTAAAAPVPAPVSATATAAVPAAAPSPGHCSVRRVAIRRWPHGPMHRAALAQALSGKSVRVLGGTLEAQRTFIELLTALDATIVADGSAHGVIDLTAQGGRDPQQVALALIENAQQIGAPAGFYLVITGGDGHCGLVSPDAVAASARGVAKSLAREWPETAVVAVDLPRGDVTPRLAGLALAEIAREATEREVGLTVDERTTVSLTDAATGVVQNAPEGADGWTWLVSGGARGITATIVNDLATRKLGGRFVLLGRTPLSGDPSTLAAVDMSAERARLKTELKAAGSRVTPKILNEKLAGVVKQKEISETILRLRETGAEVIYETCDVGSVSDVARVVTGLGTIDACIHGAGAEDSQRLEAKSASSVARCFGAKVGGVTNLIAALPESCKVLVGFGSISGHFGNAGQVDYAAANEAMAKLVATWGQPEGRLGMTVHWSAWADVGMATRGSVGTVLQSIGIELIKPETAAPVVGDLVASGFSGEAVAAGRLGALDAPRAAATALLGPDGQPLALNPGRDAALDDHRIDGTAVLPGVLGMELFAQHVHHQSEAPVLGLEAVSFTAPVKYHRDRSVPLDIVSADGASTLFATRSLVAGKTRREAHFVGTVLVAPGEPMTALAGLGDRRLREGPDADGIYDVFFHTGLFRVLENVPWIGDSSIVAFGRAPEGPLTPGVGPLQLLTDPLTREMGFQAAGLCAMAAFEQRYLPGGVERVELRASAIPGEQVIARAIDVTDNAQPEERIFDVDLITAAGETLQRLRGLRMVAAGPLPAGKKVETRESSFPINERMTITGAERELSRLGGELVDIFDERSLQAYERFRSPLRKREWLAARLALKKMVQRWLLGVHGVYRTLKQLAVIADPNGAPHLHIDGPPPGVTPAVSLAHSCGEALATFDPRGGRRIGVDLEAVAPRGDAFKTTYSDEELALQPAQMSEDRFLTSLWCVKEAVSKALGLGFALTFGEVAITSLGEHVATVEPNGRAAERCAQLGVSIESVALDYDGMFVTATAQAAQASPLTAADSAPVGPISARGLAALAALIRHKGVEALGAPPETSVEAESVKELVQQERRKLVASMWGNA